MAHLLYGLGRFSVRRRRHDQRRVPGAGAEEPDRRRRSHSRHRNGGPAAWWVPRWLDRLLPNLDVEGSALLATLEAEATAGVEAGVDADRPAVVAEPELVP